MLNVTKLPGRTLALQWDLSADTEAQSYPMTNSSSIVVQIIDNTGEVEIHGSLNDIDYSCLDNLFGLPMSSASDGLSQTGTIPAYVKPVFSGGPDDSATVIMYCKGA